MYAHTLKLDGDWQTDRPESRFLRQPDNRVARKIWRKKSRKNEKSNSNFIKSLERTVLVQFWQQIIHQISKSNSCNYIFKWKTNRMLGPNLAESRKNVSSKIRSIGRLDCFCDSETDRQTNGHCHSVTQIYSIIKIFKYLKIEYSNMNIVFLMYKYICYSYLIKLTWRMFIRCIFGMNLVDI